MVIMVDASQHLLLLFGQSQNLFYFFLFGHYFVVYISIAKFDIFFEYSVHLYDVHYC